MLFAKYLILPMGPDGAPVVKVIFPHETIVQVQTDHFRLAGAPLAGNISAWPNLQACVDDQEVAAHLGAALRSAIERGKEDHSITLSLPRHIGWVTRVPTQPYLQQQLRRPSSGIPVLPKELILAPKTTQLTMKVRMRKERNQQWHFTVWTVYPGYYPKEERFIFLDPYNTGTP